MKNIIGSHLYILFHRKSFQSARFFGCEHVFSAMPLYKKSISWNNSKEKFEYQILNLKPIKVVLLGKIFGDRKECLLCASLLGQTYLQKSSEKWQKCMLTAILQT